MVLEDMTHDGRVSEWWLDPNTFNVTVINICERKLQSVKRFLEAHPQRSEYQSVFVLFHMRTTTKRGCMHSMSERPQCLCEPPSAHTLMLIGYTLITLWSSWLTCSDSAWAAAPTAVVNLHVWEGNGSECLSRCVSEAGRKLKSGWSGWPVILGNVEVCWDRKCEKWRKPATM